MHDAYVGLRSRRAKLDGCVGAAHRWHQYEAAKNGGRSGRGRRVRSVLKYTRATIWCTTFFLRFLVSGAYDLSQTSDVKKNVAATGQKTPMTKVH